MYTVMFFIVTKFALDMTIIKSIGVAYILGFISGLLNAIYIEARDIRRLIVKNNEQTQTENSEKDKQ
jgi:preprotein translocase subunit SecF